MDATTAIANHDDDPLAAAISAELTLEAALAFIDSCSLDSDEEAGPAVAVRQAKSRIASHRTRRSAAAAAPPSPLFFGLVDLLENESDSEYISMEDALKMLDTCEIDDATGVVRQQQKEKMIPRTTFTELVRAVSPTGSSDSDGNSDASAESSATTASSIKSSACKSVRKPKQRAATAKTPKAGENSVQASAKLRKTVKKPAPAPDAVTDKGTTSTTTAKLTKKRVRRQREELLYLREKVVEMQQVLESLQKVDNRSSDTTSSSSTTAVSSPTSSFDPEAALIEQQQQQPSISFSPSKVDSSRETQVGSAAWKALAERQLQERERSEQENRQLKATLEGQIKLVRSLEQLLIGPLDIEVRSSFSWHVCSCNDFVCSNNSGMMSRLFVL